MTTTTTEVRESEVRFDLIDEQIAWAEAEEAKGKMSAWNQGDWLTNEAPCGTAYCIAGHVAIQAGYRQINSYLMEHPETGHRDWPWNIATRRLGYADVMDRAFDEQHAEVHPAIERGESRAYYLSTDIFDAGNTIADLKRIRDTYARLEGVPTRYDEEIG